MLSFIMIVLVCNLNSYFCSSYVLPIDVGKQDYPRKHTLALVSVFIEISNDIEYKKSLGKLLENA